MRVQKVSDAEKAAETAARLHGLGRTGQYKARSDRVQSGFCHSRQRAFLMQPIRRDLQKLLGRQS